jgi:hypothetical protein
LTGLARHLYLACDACHTLDELTRLATDATSSPVSHEAVELALAPLIEQGLMVRDGNAVLSLAIPLGDYSPSEAVLERFDRLVDTLGAANGVVVI